MNCTTVQRTRKRKFKHKERVFQRFLLKSESSDDLDDYIRKWHNCQSDNSIYESFPGFFEILLASPCGKKHKSDIEKYRYAHDSEKTHKIHLDIFEEIILKGDIRTTVSTIITTANLKHGLGYSYRRTSKSGR